MPAPGHGIYALPAILRRNAERVEWRDAGVFYREKAGCTQSYRRPLAKEHQNGKWATFGTTDFSTIEKSLFLMRQTQIAHRPAVG